MTAPTGFPLPRPEPYASCAASTAIGCTRARRIASASPRRPRTRAVPAEPGATTPTRVSVARLRISDPGDVLRPVAQVVLEPRLAPLDLHVLGEDRQPLQQDRELRHLSSDL